jgi:hypothetical protein
MSGPIPDMFDLSALSGFLSRFQRPNSDMSGPQPYQASYPRLPQPYQASYPRLPHLIRLLSQVPEMVVGHVWVSDTQRIDFLRGGGAIKGLPHHSNKVGHSVQLVKSLIYSLELSTSLLQASFKSKLPMRDLSLTLEWPTWFSTQSLHRWSLCVCYSWGFIPLNGLGCPRVTKVVVDFKKFVLSSPLWEFDSENWTKSWWSFRVD